MPIENNEGINSLILKKVADNKKHRELLVLINQDADKALHEIREAYGDVTLFSNYEIMLSGTERSIAISNMVNRINEQMIANNEVITNSVNNDLSDIKSVLKERFKLIGINTVIPTIDSLYTTLNKPDTLNLVANMYSLDKIRIKYLAGWFKANANNISALLAYDITKFITDTESITSTYVDQSLELLNTGIKLDVEFTESDIVRFTIDNDNGIEAYLIAPVENIKYLVETAIGLEPMVEVINQTLFNNITKFKPSSTALATILKLSSKATSDYNENKITSEAYLELSKSYDAMVITYFNIFNIRLMTLSSYIDVYVETVIINLNRVVQDINYLQNSFK